jgi:hypothetical protein
MLLLHFLSVKILSFLTGSCEKKILFVIAFTSVFTCVNALTVYRGWAYMINSQMRY